MSRLSTADCVRLIGFRIVHSLFPGERQLVGRMVGGEWANMGSFSGCLTDEDVELSQVWSFKVEMVDL